MFLQICSIIGHPEPPRNFYVRCYTFICLLRWQIPQYTGHGHSGNVNYILQYKLKNQDPVRRSISSTSTFIHLRKGIKHIYVRVWSNSTAGRSVYPIAYKIVIPPNHPINNDESQSSSADGKSILNHTHKTFTLVYVQCSRCSEPEDQAY